MKKFICLMLVIALTFSFSACGYNSKSDNSKEEEVLELNQLTFIGLAEAYSSGNGAVYQDYINSICDKNYKCEVAVRSVEDTYRITCSNAYPDNPALTYRSIVVDRINLNTSGQLEILKTLKEGDEIEFEGKLTDASASDKYGGGVKLHFDFEKVIIKSVNGTAVQ